MSEITIYGVPQSTYVRTVRMAAEEKGVAYEIVPATPDSADITSLHPFAKMPAVRHGDHVFWETPAITDYIDQAFDGPALMPADPAARALALSWISAVEDYIYPVAIRRYVLQYIFPKGADGQPDRAVIDPAVEEIKGHLQRIDDQLAKTAWIGGDDFTLATFRSGLAHEGFLE